MNAERSTPSSAEVADELAKWAVGLGIVTHTFQGLARSESGLIASLATRS